jgi:pyruvate dehydrogenase E2 component (dihydrolipoamide acetyltransferase)
MGATRRRPRKTTNGPAIPATPVANPERVAVDTPPAGTPAPQEGTPSPAPVAGAHAAVPGSPTITSAAVSGAPTSSGSARSGTGQAGATRADLSPAQAAVLAKPPVRKLAKDLGVDLATLAGAGTGPHGSVTREDIQAAAQGTTQRATEQRAPIGTEERIPVKGVRRMTAQAMVTSAFTAPHVTEFLQLDVTETMEAVRRLRALPDFAEVKVSPLLLVAKAVLTAARRHPMINSSWDDSAQEIVVKHYVNLGIAAATPRGLVVPNIKDAHALSLPELAVRLGRLAETARAGRTQPAEMSGGTITITNVGVFGVDTGTPILNPGESAILAFGQIRDMPWVVDGALAVRKVTTLALSFDHRIVDGELGSLFLRDVGAMLEDPLRMLAWS